MQISRRNARFQQWHALLSNRAKRQRAGEFLVQGVRPITMALRFGWPVRTMLYHAEADLSRWANETLTLAAAPTVGVAGDLLAELGEKPEAPPELVAVVELPADELARIPAPSTGPVLVLDRPSSPGNLGTSIRSADAFGAVGVVVTGHATDVYDPRTVRASTGSLFAVPTVRVAGPQPVREWLSRVAAGARLLGTDENGELPLAEAELTGPTVLLVGNETSGLSTAWREACDQLLQIPIAGSASSLNAATSAGIVLYEAARQRWR